MIKNFLDTDDELLSETKVSIEEKTASPADEIFDSTEIQPSLKDNAPRQVFEIPENAKFFAPPVFSGEKEKPQAAFEKIETPVAANTENEIPLNQETNRENLYAEMVGEQIERDKEAETESAKAAETPIEKPLFQSNYTPETPDETIRKSGMAYSAAIVLLVSIVFMMLLGWFADLLLGSKPFGIVGGIILGAVVGFIQFFRITSSLFK